MKTQYKLLSLAAIATIAPLTSLQAAQAGTFNDGGLPVYSEFTVEGITAKVTKGINLEDNQNGSLGAFSDFYYTEGVETIDFNDPSQRKAVEGKANTYTFGNDAVQFSFDKALGQNRTNVSGLSTQWGPTGANGEKNTSNYLGVFKGNSVTIDLADDLNYFGMNWGALSPTNTFEFLQVDDNGVETSLGQFDYNNIFGTGQEAVSKLPTWATHQKEYNGYVHFYANEEQGLFNRIKVSQLGGGGFETDNYSFRFSDKSFDFETGNDSTEVPEPGMILGLISMGAMFLRRRS